MLSPQECSIYRGREPPQGPRGQLRQPVPRRATREHGTPSRGCPPCRPTCPLSGGSRRAADRPLDRARLEGLPAQAARPAKSPPRPRTSSAIAPTSRPRPQSSHSCSSRSALRTPRRCPSSRPSARRTVLAHVRLARRAAGVQPRRDVLSPAARKLGGSTEPDVDPEDPNSDIPDELPVILSGQSDGEMSRPLTAFDDTLPFRPPGSPQQIVLIRSTRSSAGSSARSTAPGSTRSPQPARMQHRQNESKSARAPSRSRTRSTARAAGAPRPHLRRR